MKKMNKIIPIIVLMFVFCGLGSISISVSAEHLSEGGRGGWIQNTAKWWSNDQVGDTDFLGVIKEMIKRGEISIQNIPEQTSSGSEQKIPSWVKNPVGWWADGLISYNEFVHALQFLIQEGIIQVDVSIPPTSQDCSGSAACISGHVSRIVDGDTIYVDGKSIRFSLASTPELNEHGGLEAKQFVEEICPVGSEALVDEDDGQTEGSYGRMIAVIYCNGINLNEAVLESGHGWLSSGFCYKSEFSSEAWAQKHGCN